MSDSILRYPGGKSKSCDSFTPFINEHADLEYREPFFGGGSVGLGVILQSRCPSYWVNDLDIGLTALWQAVAFHSEELKIAIMKCEAIVANFDRLKHYFRSGPAVPTDAEAVVRLGCDKLAMHRLSHGGLGAMAGGPLGGRFQTNGGIDSRWNPEVLCKKIDKISAHLSRARITSVDFANLILDESRPAVLYLDPPYYTQGKNLSQHAFNDADHRRLRDLLQVTSHSWILSYDDCPAIRDLYAFADIRQVELRYSMGRQEKRTELIICKPTAQTPDILDQWKSYIDQPQSGAG